MIPDPDDPRWGRVLTSESELTGSILATKILITRLRREVQARPGALAEKILELRTYFEKNASAAKDIALF